MPEINETPNPEADNEIHIYTWLNCTLRELVNTMKTSLKQANKKSARITFYHVYQDTSGRFKKKQISTVHSVKKGKDDELTLVSFRFEIGDIIDVNICTENVQSEGNQVVRAKRRGFYTNGGNRRGRRGGRDRNSRGRKGRWEHRGGDDRDQRRKMREEKREKRGGRDKERSRSRRKDKKRDSVKN